MIEKILNFFGLTTLKSQAITVNALIKTEEKIVKESDEKLDKYKSLFDWDIYEKTLISWTDWKIKNNIAIPTIWSDEFFYKYYKETRRKQYIAFKIRTISQYPDFLYAFLLEFSNYDFNADAIFFKKIKFTYSRETEMSAEVLKDTVITLLPKDFDGVNEKVQGISSGGYEVCFYYEKDNQEPKCKIKFDKACFYKYQD